MLNPEEIKAGDVLYSFQYSTFKKYRVKRVIKLITVHVFELEHIGEDFNTLEKIKYDRSLGESDPSNAAFAHLSKSITEASWIALEDINKEQQFLEIQKEKILKITKEEVEKSQRTL